MAVLCFNGRSLSSLLKLSINIIYLIILLFLGPSALFTPIGLGKVTGHVISSKNVTHVTDCMKLCMVTEQCNSFSFNERLKNCQVSGSTAEVQSLENQDGFNYYERAAFPVMTP